MDAIELRRRIVESWARVGGDLLLDQLAKDDPKAYLELVVRLLPRVTPQELQRSDRGPAIVLQLVEASQEPRADLVPDRTRPAPRLKG